MTMHSEQAVDDAQQSWRQWRTPSTEVRGLIEAAGRIKGLLREQADEAETLGRYTEAAHDAMVEALTEEREAFLEEQGRYEDWLASQSDEAE